MPSRTVLAISIASALVGCSNDGSETYTLYRSSLIDPTLRVHVATFDANDVGDYNRLNCEEAAQLYRDADGEEKRWWCEPGTFRE